MKLSLEDIKLLGLSRTEIRVLDALRAGKDTPLLISKYKKVSRPAVYEILDRLHKRGLIKSNISNGKKYWSQAKERDLEQELYNTKKQLFNMEDGTKEIKGMSDPTVIIHRGTKAVKKILDSIVKDYKGQRLYAIQGDKIGKGWEHIYGTSGIDKWNSEIKKKKIITEMIFPDGIFERQIRIYGKKWAKNFEGRSAVTHEIDKKYFQHGGQILIFRNSLYLIAVNEEVVIEVHNSEIQKLVLSMFRFIQDNSHKIDINEILRELIAK